MFKNDLAFLTQLMNAAGMLGFAPDPHAGVRAFPDGSRGDLGVFITNPLSLRPRKPTARPELLTYPGGLLLHTGLPNPGLTAAIKKYARRWETSPQPVIIHLMADRPEETARMVQQIEELENIAAIELGFAPLLADEIIMLSLEMSLGELPLIANLPFEQLLNLGPRLVERGAAALSLAAPRGALPVESADHPQSPEVLSGRLYGPSLFAQSFSLLRSAIKLGLPVIGGVGVYSQEQAGLMLASGALAVQLDTVLWM